MNRRVSLAACVTWGFLAASTGTAFAQGGAIDKRLEELERRMGELEKEPAVAKPDGAEIRATFKDGLKVRSTDGNLDMHIGGRFLEHLRIVEDTPDAAFATFPRESGFLIRQARLEASGTLWKEFEFKVQGDWGQGASVLQDAYVGWKGLQELSLRFGQFKEPFSYPDEMTSTRFIPFAERVTGNRLVPARDVGVMLHGRFFEGRVGVELALFNGSGQNPGAGADLNDEKDIAGRVFFKPIREGDLKGLMIGVGGTRGDNDDPVLGDIRTRQTETRVIDMDGATVIAGDRHRLGFELQVPDGPFGLEAEWYRVSMDLRDPDTEFDDDIDFDQWYVTATWIVTGEKKEFNDRVRPENPFDRERGHFGAIEVALRFARFEVDDAILDDGFALAGTTTTRTDEMTGGVNWWPVANVRITLNVVHNRYDDDLVAASDEIDSETAAFVRFQVDF